MSSLTTLYVHVSFFLLLLSPVSLISLLNNVYLPNSQTPSTMFVLEEVALYDNTCSAVHSQYFTLNTTCAFYHLCMYVQQEVVFSQVCVCSTFGGYPIPSLGGGYPIPDLARGVPSLRSRGGTRSEVCGYPISGLGVGGTPSQVHGVGVPHLQSRGYPISGPGVTHLRSRGYPISGPGGTPPDRSA